MGTESSSAEPASSLPAMSAWLESRGRSRFYRSRQPHCCLMVQLHDIANVGLRIPLCKTTFLDNMPSGTHIVS